MEGTGDTPASQRGEVVTTRRRNPRKKKHQGVGGRTTRKPRLIMWEGRDRRPRKGENSKFMPEKMRRVGIPSMEEGSPRSAGEKGRFEWVGQEDGGRKWGRTELLEYLARIQRALARCVGLTAKRPQEKCNAFHRTEKVWVWLFSKKLKTRIEESSVPR